MTAGTLPRRRNLRAVAGALSLVVLTGCGFQGAQSLPLPGGKGGGGYQLIVEFQDVLDLAVQSAVKTNDVTVGRVENIELTGYTAKVTVLVDKATKLPANADVSLRQTSLLGEKFVSIDPPKTDRPQGELRNGDIIGIDRTTRNVEIEELLAALSLVLNGGNLEQLYTINVELAKALKGREPQVKSLLAQLNTFIGGLDQQKANIVRALDGLDRLTARLADNRETLAVALRDIPDGLRELNAQRDDIVQVLQGLDKLSVVATRVIRESKSNTVESLRLLAPILANVNAAGKAFPRSLELLLTYPFPKTAVDAIYGDYTNLYITLQLKPPPPQAGGLPALPLPPLPRVLGLDLTRLSAAQLQALLGRTTGAQRQAVEEQLRRLQPRAGTSAPPSGGGLTGLGISNDGRANWSDMLLGGMS